MPYMGSFRGIDFDQDGDADYVDDNLLDELDELDEFEDEDDIDDFDDLDEDELEAAGLDYMDLSLMDEDERREVLEDAGLDPDDYDF